MSYNLHFDSLVSYRLLERKSFSIRTLNLLYCLPAPRVTVWWQSGFSHFCAICPHPGTSIIHRCCTFSLFSSPTPVFKASLPGSTILLTPPTYSSLPCSSFGLLYSLTGRTPILKLPSRVKESPLWQGYKSGNHQWLHTSTLVGAARGLVNMRSCVTVVPSWGPGDRRASQPHSLEYTSRFSALQQSAPAKLGSEKWYGGLTTSLGEVGIFSSRQK